MDDEIYYEVKRIENENAWPHYPILPMKNRQQKQPGGFPRLGILIAGHGPRVYLDVNMWAIPKDLSTVLTESFESTQALVEEGWVSD